MSENKFRKLNSRERAILNRLLENSFLGRDEIREQIENSTVRLISDYNDNYGSLEFNTSSDLLAPVKSRVPVEGLAFDEKVPVEFLLHVYKGKIKELEVVRLDGKTLKKVPNPSEIKVKIRDN